MDIVSTPVVLVQFAHKLCGLCCSVISVGALTFDSGVYLIGVVSVDRSFIILCTWSSTRLDLSKKKLRDVRCSEKRIIKARVVTCIRP